MLGPVATLMEQKLRLAFAPTMLTITDQSALHHGHAGAHPEGESHFFIHIISDAFANKSRLDSHRSVYDALGAELINRVHALVLKLESPDEAIT
jgi:BolA protein